MTLGRTDTHGPSLILVLNCGSSSIKFALFDTASDPPSRQPVWNGKVQGIGGEHPDFGETGVTPCVVSLDPAQPYRCALDLILRRVHAWRQLYLERKRRQHRPNCRAR